MEIYPLEDCQVVYTPKECRKAFRAYLKKRGIVYKETRTYFTIPRNLRPHAWKIGCPCEVPRENKDQKA